MGNYADGLFSATKQNTPKEENSVARGVYNICYDPTYITSSQDIGFMSNSTIVTHLISGYFLLYSSYSSSIDLKEIKRLVQDYYFSSEPTIKFKCPNQGNSPKMFVLNIPIHLEYFESIITHACKNDNVNYNQHINELNKHDQILTIPKLKISIEYVKNGCINANTQCNYYDNASKVLFEIGLIGMKRLKPNEETNYPYEDVHNRIYISDMDLTYDPWHKLIKTKQDLESTKSHTNNNNNNSNNTSNDNNNYNNYNNYNHGEHTYDLNYSYSNIKHINQNMNNNIKKIFSDQDVYLLNQLCKRLTYCTANSNVYPMTSFGKVTKRLQQTEMISNRNMYKYDSRCVSMVVDHLFARRDRMYNMNQPFGYNNFTRKSNNYVCTSKCKHLKIGDTIEMTISCVKATYDRKMKGINTVSSIVRPTVVYQVEYAIIDCKTGTKHFLKYGGPNGGLWPGTFSQENKNSSKFCLLSAEYGYIPAICINGCDGDSTHGIVCNVRCQHVL